MDVVIESSAPHPRLRACSSLSAEAAAGCLPQGQPDGLLGKHVQTNDDNRLRHGLTLLFHSACSLLCSNRRSSRLNNRSNGVRENKPKTLQG
jgi:hypothetical protein